jgi:ATP-binding cassette, subfamily C (CFTR/MRP), member 1
MVGYMSQVTTFPFILIFCTIILFHYLGWSFVSAIGVFAVTFLVNFWTGKRGAKLQKEYMKRSDRRVKTTNESMNNIKMLKLYSWTEIFAETIRANREEELGWLWKRFQNGQIVVTSLYFFPAVLSAVVFAFYIGFGNPLDLAIAFTVITMLNMIKEPLRMLPLFVGSFLEFLVSMKRI